MTDRRPELTKGISPADFTDFYWMKEELVAFCKQQGITASGSKPELTARITEYLTTGRVERRAAKNAPTSRFSWATEPLSLTTVITDSYRNTENVRAFMAREIGPHFRFNVVFIQWVQQNAGKTLKDAVEEWKRIYAQKKNGTLKTTIAPQFEYNTYIRDFMADNPDKTLQDAIRCWNVKRAKRGSNKYAKEDVDAGSPE